MLKAGELTDRVTLLSPTVTQADDGQPLLSWSNPTTIGPLWAKVEELGGRETRRGEQIVSEHSHRVTIRYRTGLTSSMRVTWGSRTLEVDGLPTDPEGLRAELILMCRETVT